MPASMRKLKEIAGRFGADITNERSVNRWFKEKLPKLPAKTREAILQEVLEDPGELSD